MTRDTIVWVMSEATRPAERLAFHDWLVMATIAISRGAPPQPAFEVAFDQLTPEAQRALVALSERAPRELGFTQFRQPLPGARPGHD